MKSLILSVLVVLFACSGNLKSDTLSEMKANGKGKHGHITTPPPTPHFTSRNDIFVCGTHANPTYYYQFADQDFNTMWGLNPGDTVYIKQGANGENFIDNIDLGLGSSNGIVLMPDPSNTVVIEIGWIGVGDNGQNWEFNGYHPTLGRGFVLTSTTHFGLSLGCVGNIKVSNMHVNGALMGMQLVTVEGHTYPLNYQRLFSHDNYFENTINESFYLGYVNNSPIAMDIFSDRDTIINAGYDGFQTRNTDTVQINNLYINGAGIANVGPHSHGVLFGSNSNGGTVTNSKILNVTGVGIWNGGWGDFVYKCNQISANSIGIMSRSSFPEGDVQNTGRQTQNMNNNTIVCPLSVECYYENNGKAISAYIQQNNVSGTVNVAVGITGIVSNNSSTVNTICSQNGIIY